MKLLFFVSLFVLTLTTGFTCSKNTPEAAKTEAPAQDSNSAQPTQEQMAQPAAEPPPTPDAPAAQPSSLPADHPPVEGEKK